jgi:hypothetical protein
VSSISYVFSRCSEGKGRGGEVLAVEDRDGKLNPAQEDFLFSEAAMIMTYSSCAVNFLRRR